MRSISYFRIEHNRENQHLFLVRQISYLSSDDYESRRGNNVNRQHAVAVSETRSYAVGHTFRHDDRITEIFGVHKFTVENGHNITGGKGGGRGTRAQGQAKTVLSPEGLEQLKTYFLQRLK